MRAVVDLASTLLRLDEDSWGSRRESQTLQTATRRRGRATSCMKTLFRAMVTILEKTDTHTDTHIHK